jgi:hypothetical protein
MTKTQKISEMIMIEFAKTGSMPQAYDAVFGEGAYMALASQVYDELRAKAGL